MVTQNFAGYCQLLLTVSIFHSYDFFVCFAHDSLELGFHFRKESAGGSQYAIVSVSVMGTSRLRFGSP